MIVLIPNWAWAHEGHGAFQGSGWHYLTSYVHFVPLVVLAVGAILVIRKYWLRKTEQKHLK